MPLISDVRGLSNTVTLRDGSVPRWSCTAEGCQGEATFVNFWALKLWEDSMASGVCNGCLHSLESCRPANTFRLDVYRPIVHIEPGTADHVAWEITLLSLFRTLLCLSA